MNSRIRVSLLIFVSLLPTIAFGHCDTLAGPVVSDAKQAIVSHDVTPVLKWLKPGDESEIRRVFEQTMNIRQLSPQARELADRYFFETLVRLHRAGEGAPYTGLKDDDAEPIIRLTDASLTDGSSVELLQTFDSHLRSELTKRLAAAQAARKQAASSVEDGRHYVSTYIELTHFVERVHNAIMSSGEVSENHETGQLSHRE